MTLDAKFVHWTVEFENDIAWLKLDKADSAVNVLSTDVMRELDQLVDDITGSPLAGLVIFSGKSTGFVMGADINEFPSIDTAERAYEVARLGQELLAKIEALPCPTVAAINGFALGGGLELAMACDYRVVFATVKPILGLPEVQLGLHPGFGGTVRVVQICGVRPGMKLMLTGKPITAENGLAIGLVDRIAGEAEWREAAIELIHAARPKKIAPITERILNFPLLRPLIRSMLVKPVAARAQPEHYPAPYAIIDLWVRHGASSRTGYRAEAESFAELMCSSSSKNLVRVFFLQNKLKNQGNKVERKIASVHVVGAGVMGGDIASWCALRGLDVTLQDRESTYIEAAIECAHKFFDKKLRDPRERHSAAEGLKPDLAGDGAARADLVIEAIFEDPDAKRTLYAELEQKMAETSILATNTSTIPLEELRYKLARPTRFIGLHFFNPVAKMPLVEVVRAADTEQEALDIGFAFVRRIGKYPLECLSSPGFVVNRILAPYMMEALYLLDSGVSMADVDHAAERFGMPMGPVELADSVGLDIVLASAHLLADKDSTPSPEILEQRVARGDLGRKSGQGFYRWADGKALKDEASGLGSAPELEDRLILPMVNEAVACLADGIVNDADLLDAGVIFGTGFAPFRGGPINYARERGVDAVVARLDELASQHGDRFRPHPGWSNL